MMVPFGNNQRLTVSDQVVEGALEIEMTCWPEDGASTWIEREDAERLIAQLQKAFGLKP